MERWNQSFFFFVFTHEIAHLVAFHEKKNNSSTWKRMEDDLSENAFGEYFDLFRGAETFDFKFC